MKLRDNVEVRLEPGTYKEMDDAGLVSLHICIGLYDRDTGVLLEAASIPVSEAVTEEEA